MVDGIVGGVADAGRKFGPCVSVCHDILPFGAFDGCLGDNFHQCILNVTSSLDLTNTLKIIDVRRPQCQHMHLGIRSLSRIPTHISLFSLERQLHRISLVSGTILPHLGSGYLLFPPGILVAARIY